MIAVAALLIALFLVVTVVGAIGVVTLIRSVLPEIRQKLVVPDVPADPILAAAARNELKELALRLSIPAPLVTVVPILGQPVDGGHDAAIGTGGLAESRILCRNGQPPLVILAAGASHLSRAALEALLAHELAHVERYSTLQGRRRLYAVLTCWAALPILAGAAAVIAAWPAGVTVALTYGLITMMVAALVVTAVAQAFARREELAADLFALDLTGNLGAVEELLTVYARRRAIRRLPAAVEALNRLFASHPDPEARLVAMRTRAQQQR